MKLKKSIEAYGKEDFSDVVQQELDANPSLFDSNFWDIDGCDLEIFIVGEPFDEDGFIKLTVQVSAEVEIESSCSEIGFTDQKNERFHVSIDMKNGEVEVEHDDAWEV
jgi:hypothetical protein